MRSKAILSKFLTLILALTIIMPLMQTTAASAASSATTEKKVTVKFTKTKAAGFKTISDISTGDKYVIALGTKASGNVLAYSTDGTTFKDIDLDSVITKEYAAVKFSEVKLNSYISSIDKQKIYCIMGKGTAEDNTVYNFLVSISSDLKKISVIKLDDAVKKLDSEAANITFQEYLNFDYDSGVVIYTGSYTNTSGAQINFYAVSTKITDVTAYEFPDNECENIDLVGKYLICYKWQLAMNDSNKGEFYYSSDYKTWKKATTPKVDGAVSWRRAYFDWESFCVSPEDYTADIAYVYYTSDMKTYKNISKTYAISGDGRNISFNKFNDTIFATEDGYNEKRQLVFSKKSTKAGSDWKKLFSYTAKDNENFDYNLEYWMAGGLVLIKDGSTKKLFKLSDGKEYNTSLDTTKLNLYTEEDGICYGFYDNQYILASKNGLVKNYLFKTPDKVNGMSIWYSKNRYYVYSDTAIYYVTESAINKGMK